MFSLFFVVFLMISAAFFAVFGAFFALSWGRLGAFFGLSWCGRFGVPFSSALFGELSFENTVFLRVKRPPQKTYISAEREAR